MGFSPRHLKRFNGVALSGRVWILNVRKKCNIVAGGAVYPCKNEGLAIEGAKGQKPGSRDGIVADAGIV
jgi:hypothetical protein